MKRFFSFFILATTASLSGFIPTNLEWPYDRQISSQQWHKNLIHFGISSEYMVSNCCYDPDQNRVAPTQIYGQKESSLALLEGHDVGSDLNLLSNRLRGMQDGMRGMFKVTGDFEAYTASLDAKVHISWLKSLPGSLSIGLSVPFHYQAMKNVMWKSLTKNETVQDGMVRTELANDEDSLIAFVEKHAGLDIKDQTRRGLGDISVLFDWQCWFLENHNRLKYVFVNLRSGLTFPTSHAIDINKSFDPSFGHDNSFSVPLGGGLELGLSDEFAIGADVTATLLMRRSAMWRLQSSWAQTQHLLPKTGEATKEYGPEWKFKLYGKYLNLLPGVSIVGGYQFYKHTDSTLYEQDNAFSSSMINRSTTVDISESHNGFVSAVCCPVGRVKWPVIPELSLGVKIPINGRQVMSGYTVQCGASLRF